MKRVMRQAYTEMDELLKYLPKEYVEKIPMKYKRLFHDARLEDYEVKIDVTQPAEKQNFVYETFVILTILKLNYWCETQQEKDEIMEQLKENEKKYQEQFDISKLNSRQKEENKETISPLKTPDNLPIPVKEKSWVKKLFSKIKMMFKK